MIRIIAGSAKGKALKSPRKGSLIRPLLARARQSFFDTIRPWVTGSHFLDLYAGSGLVGCEAISRGAEFTAFLEKGREGLKLIGRNIELLVAQEKSMVVVGDILGGALMLLRTRLPPDFVFDIVFSSPPYLGEDRRGKILVMTVPTLQMLAQSRLLAPGAWVVMQHHKKEPMADMPGAFQFDRDVRFGDSVLTYLRWDKGNGAKRRKYQQ